ncbi:GNAT family N-acetyltransferase [archaeon]|jgi:[ribosomal protein S5]-alanine N-acetyltransferase|nr:GNAT family N-acetyltransferase [archaeon]MBT6868913.1 GNAT family N-acetyltransferase [archaeon]MBT7192866.1 GNAT family N-acetyltransferase [archaeon]MBT7380832.1 GNAT family N-acetyltransferase [archaeon]MBT7507587.1 GNAT family N-acetyltransferase [archaeon]
MKIELRYPKVSDAKKFLDILKNPNFKYFSFCPISVEEEIKWIKNCVKNRKNNLEYNYAIILGGKLIGGCGIKIDQHLKHIGEIGYFVAEEYWGKGIATKAVKLLEKIAFKDLKLRRLTILMSSKNKGSEKVAIKCGYKKEGTMRKYRKLNSKLTDYHLYAKVK